MKVMKFGGTSVQNADAIRCMQEIVANETEQCLIVVSAFASITDSLHQLVDHLNNTPHLIQDELDFIRNRHLEVLAQLRLLATPAVSEVNDLLKELDMHINICLETQQLPPGTIAAISGLGEQLSSRIIFRYLQSNGLDIAFTEAKNLIFRSDSETSIDFTRTEKAVTQTTLPLFTNHRVVITQGYVAATADGKITTLGRGGSDFSAAILAWALQAEELEIWTDVDGVMSSDPRIIPQAQRINHLTYSEAAELAYFGAKILHPKTMAPAVNRNIPITVKNTLNPQFPGTVINSNPGDSDSIKALAFRRDITVINIISNRMLGAYGFLSRVFEVFDNHKTAVDLVATSEVSISLTVDSDQNLSAITTELEQFSEVKIQRNMAIIAAVGTAITNTAGIASAFFGALQDINISMVSIGASDINMSVVVANEDLYSAVQQLHNKFKTETTSTTGDAA